MRKQSPLVVLGTFLMKNPILLFVIPAVVLMAAFVIYAGMQPRRDTQIDTRIVTGRALLGVSEDDLIKRFGSPIDVHKGHNSTDGDFTILRFDARKGHETFFTCWDGVAHSGYYDGIEIRERRTPKR